jgi:alkylation response protein AidB-like acyl-CoA dehydrogenase
VPATAGLKDAIGSVLAVAAENAARADADGKPSAASLEALRATGMLGLVVPPEYGGLGQDACMLNRFIADLAGADAGIAIIAFQHFAVCARIAEWGTPAQREALLPLAARGSLMFASAWSETGASADKKRMATRAQERADGSWLLNGAKSFATGAGVADLYLILTQSSDAEQTTSAYGGAGQTFFLVEASNPGLLAELSMDLVGMRASATGFVRLRDCEVPAQAVLGPADGAAQVIASVRDSGATLGAVSAGLARAAYDLLVAHLSRQGRLDAPAVWPRLVEIATQVEAIRAVVDQAGRRDSAAPGALTLHSKLFASVLAEAVTGEAARMLGSAGFLAPHPINRLARDARAVALMGPTNDVCRELLKSYV